MGTLLRREFPLETEGTIRLATQRCQARRGFSLIEVTLALAVMAFSISVIFGLLGVGVASFHQAKAVVVSSQIAQQVFSQLQSIPFDTLVKNITNATPRYNAATLTKGYYVNSMTVNGTAVQTLYFDELGNELSSSTGAVYAVNVRILFPTPILPTTVSSGTPVLNIDLATVMVQVALNPNGNLTPTLDATSTEWLPSAMQITNYQFFVTRNN